MTWMHTTRVLMALGFAGALSGCISTWQPLSTKSQPTPKSSYLYGRFLLQNQHVTFNSKANSIAINLYKVTPPQQTISLGLKTEEDAVYAVEVPPGTYRISGWSAGDDSRSKSFGNEDGHADIVVEPDKAYYIGDFTGKSSVKTYGNTISYRWFIDDVSYKFNKTDREFSSKYPNLLSLPHVNLQESTTASPVVAEEEQLDSSKAYVYGRFFFNSYVSEAAKKPLILLQLRNTQTSATWRIELVNDVPVQALALPPGSYTVDKLLVNGTATEYAELSALQKPFTAAAGEAVYLGDLLFVATEKRDENRRMRVYGGLEEVSQAMDKTSAELLADRPQFSGIKQRSAF